MSKVDWKNLDEKTAAVIYNESQLEKEQTIKSIESTRQKSTVLLSICLGLFTFVAGQIHSISLLFQTPLTILLIGLFLSFCFFMGGLWPRKVKSMGSTPARLLLPEVVEHGVKQLYSSLIVSVESELKRIIRQQEQPPDGSLWVLFRYV